MENQYYLPVMHLFKFTSFNRANHAVLANCTVNIVHKKNKPNSIHLLQVSTLKDTEGKAGVFAFVYHFH